MTLIGSGIWGAPSAAWGVDVWGAVENVTPPAVVTQFSVGFPTIPWNALHATATWQASEPEG